VAPEPRDVAAVEHEHALPPRLGEQGLLQLADRYQREWWLRRQRQQIRALGRQRREHNLAADGLARREIAFATIAQRRDQRLVEDVDPEGVEVREVADPRNQQLRANRVLVERWPAIHDERGKAGT